MELRRRWWCLATGKNLKKHSVGLCHRSARSKAKWRVHVNLWRAPEDYGPAGLRFAHKLHPVWFISVLLCMSFGLRSY